MDLCSYGCGSIGLYQLKNGKWCCSKSPNQCVALRKKNSEKAKQLNKFVINAHSIKEKCKWCNREITLPGFSRHEKSCYMNPINKKLCPVCDTPIKDYKNNKTCSSKCGHYYYFNMYQEFGRKAAIKRSQTIPDNELGYRKLCFRYHKKECIICGEKHIVAVHHYDENKLNNDPRNLVPLCPTHHSYMHSSFTYLIKKEVQEYVQNFKILFEKISDPKL